MILVDSLSKRYGTTNAVHGVSFRVERGEVFGLLGPNGAGKSTTLKILSGLLRADGGEVRLEGALGVAPQEISLYDELSARQNLEFFGRLHGVLDLPRRVAELLEMAGLTDRMRDRVGSFSGGMKRRLNLVVALVHDPPILLLDEPTVGVDPQTRNHLFEAIERLRNEGKTILYTTHYMEEAQRLCSRIGIIDHGKVLALDTLDGLLRSHAGPRRVRLVCEGADNEEQVEMALLPRRLEAIAAEGRRVRRLWLEEPTLEDVFLSLTGRRLRE